MNNSFFWGTESKEIKMKNVISLYLNFESFSFLIFNSELNLLTSLVANEAVCPDKISKGCVIFSCKIYSARERNGAIRAALNEISR
jgi:hypothetical protein